MSSKNRWSQNDVLAADATKSAHPELAVTPGLELTHRPSRVSGSVTAFTEGQRVVLCDQDGNLHEFKPHKGVMLHKGKPVQLVAGEWKSDAGLRFTASGSVDAGPSRAQKAKASRIWVEGIHDAELIEKIWGDDLRIEGIVVEPLHGADDLAERVIEFHPASNRRLGVLLDHLVSGSKESRIADAVTDPNVLICGHPYVDIWQAVKPAALGIAAWPEVPIGQPWKEGIIAALGQQDQPGHFWQAVLGRVSTYRDIETPLINSVEQLIDFVTVRPATFAS
ncbi:MAG: DUF3097 family protein [bacterium]|nr:DUF3097 family protein [bacterium]